MVDAVQKTKKLGRVDLDLSVLVVNDKNPNVMKSREFDLLVDNINKVGITDPIIVRPIGGGKYRIIGGHHRAKAAQFLGFSTVPCTVIDDPSFDDEAEAFQLVRHTVIHGRIDPQQFISMYYQYARKYSDEVLQESFGFAEEAEFKKLINQAAKTLPKEVQDKFKEAAKEIKTIDGLAQLLNTMFTKYGNTLPYGYMVVDYGGKQSIWLQVTSPTYKALGVIGDMCMEREVTMDDLVGQVLQGIAKGDLQEFLEAALKKTPKVSLPEGLQVMPTKENIANLGDLNV